MSDDWDAGAPPLTPEFNAKADPTKEASRAGQNPEPARAVPVTRDQANQLEKDLEAPPTPTLNYEPGNASAWRDAQDQARRDKAAQLAEVKARLKARSQKAREDFDRSR